MVRLLKMLRRMPILRIVAAADVTAGQAHPQPVPIVAEFQTVLTTIRARRHVADLIKMGAALHRCVRVVGSDSVGDPDMRPPPVVVAIDDASCLDGSDQRAPVCAFHRLLLAGSERGCYGLCAIMAPGLYDVDVLTKPGVLRPAGNPLKIPPAFSRHCDHRKSLAA